MIIVIIGAQWGDEGKGKVVDLLADRFDIVSRYQGGHNAGHSVYVDDKAFVLRLLPSGLIHPNKTCVLGNGMVIDPKAFFEKIDTTLRGIGPAYEDKAGRRGIRVADALSPDVLRMRIERNLEEANRIIVLYGQQPLRADEIYDEIAPLIERLRPYVTETSHF